MISPTPKTCNHYHPHRFETMLTFTRQVIEGKGWTKHWFIKDLQPTNKLLLYCCTAPIHKLKPCVMNDCLVLVHLVAVKIMYISPYHIKDLQPPNKQLLYCCTAPIYKLKPCVVNNCLVLVHLVAVKIIEGWKGLNKTMISPPPKTCNHPTKN
jgi:hypothetical protein